MDKLRQQEAAKSPKKETTIKTKPPSFIKVIRPITFRPSKGSHARNKAIAKNHKLKIDQRVVVYLEDREARGTVRYISETLDANGDVAVGIELVIIINWQETAFLYISNFKSDHLDIYV
jgi:hypothetical protein